jgi:hypothetical protein
MRAVSNLILISKGLRSLLRKNSSKGELLPEIITRVLMFFRKPQHRLNPTQIFDAALSRNHVSCTPELFVDWLFLPLPQYRGKPSCCRRNDSP